MFLINGCKDIIRQHKTRVMRLLGRIMKQYPRLFTHWSAGMIGVFT
ncbi:MAG: hypothetical protein OXD32_07440 [Endozoicomonadaceae bacterium]|nr:hypothetical protein [Endozoicomonadaceae bacterium]MCY4328531.1 hypothetical protein [Endozoicomonadaceae bacterium]